MIQAFIFDLDGTLADTERLHHRAWNEILMQNGVEEFSFETFLAYVGTSNEKVAGDYIASHAINKSIEELVREKQTAYMELVPEVELFEGAREIITTYQDRMAMAVASSSHRKEINAILEIHGLIEYFNCIVGGDMVVKKKPDPEIYLKTAGMLKVAPHGCMAFEDSTHGVNAAKDAGMYTVAIPNEFTRGHDFSRADKIVESLREIDSPFVERAAVMNTF